VMRNSATGEDNHSPLRNAGLFAIALDHGAPHRAVVGDQLLGRRRATAESRVSQVVFARLLDVSTGTLSKWERGRLKPRGPAGRLLHIIKNKGIAAVLQTSLRRPLRSTSLRN
jgi:hypothetical protein